MKLNFKIFFVSIFFILNNCSMSLKSLFDVLNYSKYSADFLSYVTTDKTTTDHALSYLFKRDCSLARSLKLKQICEEINKENLVIDTGYLNLNKTKKFIKKEL